MGERRGVVLYVNTIFGSIEAGDRHQKDVAPVVAAGPAEMGVAESPDHIVAVVVAGAAVPVPGAAGVGTQLYHSERIGGSREGMSMKVSSNKRIDISE